MRLFCSILILMVLPACVTGELISDKTIHEYNQSRISKDQVIEQHGQPQSIDKRDFACGQNREEAGEVLTYYYNPNHHLKNKNVTLSFDSSGRPCSKASFDSISN